MRVEADEVGAAAIDGAEQKHYVVRVRGVVAEVKEDDGHDLAMPRHEANEPNDGRILQKETKGTKKRCYTGAVVPQMVILSGASMIRGSYLRSLRCLL